MGTSQIRDGIVAYLDTGGEADYIRMIEGLGVVGQISSILIGLLVVILIAGLPIVIAIEVAYINFPVIQDGCENIKGRLRGKASRVFGLVIRDARKAVDLSHTTEYGKSANGIYLRIKCKAIFMAVFLVAMVLGPGNFLIKFAFKTAKNLIASIF